MSKYVRIHTLIADSGHSLDSRGQNAVALWYWLRSLDDSGSGCVRFTVAQAAAALDRSIVTIRRYISQGVVLGLYRGKPQKSAGVITAYLSSRDNVAMRQGLMSWGVAGDVPVERLKDIRSASTDIAIESLQKSSAYLAKKELNKRDRASVITSDVFESSDSPAGANIIYIGDRCLFVNESAIASGVSQSGVASYLNRHPNTIKRRLSTDYRDRHDLQPVFKRQLAQTKTEHEQRRIEVESEFYKDSRLFVCKGRTYKALCNLYMLTDVEIASSRVAKARYKTKVQEALHDE